MLENGLFIGLRVLLLMLSFAGLCAGLRTALKLDRFIAPFTALSGIIVLLMFGGMLGILKYVLYGLYALGYAGLIYAVLIRRQKMDRGMLALLLIYSALLIFRFRSCKFFRNDDISHWALVARHLLRHDAFPDGSASHVFFQSYPLGTAAFIYYAGRFTADIESIYLIAHNFMLGVLFLPVFSLVAQEKRARRICYPIAAAIFLFLFNCFRFMQSLQVDLHLGFFGTGMICAIARYRDDWKKAAISAVPAMLAVVYIKNSGIFFAVLGAAGLIWAAARCGMGKGRRIAIGSGFACASLLAYGAWMLHIRLRFPAALDTKHAVSLSAYAEQMREKGLDTILAITKRFAFELVRFSSTQLLAAAAMFAIGLVLLLGCLLIPSRKKDLRPVMLAYGINVGVYLVWALMILLMYIFSMPAEEALRTASFYRYNGTGLVFLIGISCALLISWLSQEEVCTKKIFSLFSSACCTVIILFLCIGGIILSGNTSFNPFGLAETVFDRNPAYSTARIRLMDAVESGTLEINSHCLIYTRSISHDSAYDYYLVKYELESGNLEMVAENPAAEHSYMIGSAWDKRSANNYEDYLADTIGSCSAIIMMDKSEEFENTVCGLMEEMQLDLPVVYAY